GAGDGRAETTRAASIQRPPPHRASGGRARLQRPLPPGDAGMAANLCSRGWVSRRRTGHGKRPPAVRDRRRSVAVAALPPRTGSLPGFPGGARGSAAGSHLDLLSDRRPASSLLYIGCSFYRSHPARVSSILSRSRARPALELLPAAWSIRPRGVSGELRQLRRTVGFAHDLRAVHAGPCADPPFPCSLGSPGAADGRGIPVGALRICSGESGGAAGALARLPDGDGLALGGDVPVDPARGDDPRGLVRLFPAPA